MNSSSKRILTTRQGFPTATAYGGMSEAATELAPIMAPSPVTDDNTRSLHHVLDEIDAWNLRIRKSIIRVGSVFYLHKFRFIYLFYLSLYELSENKHFVIFAPVFLNILGDSWAMLVFIPEFYDVEAQTVHIEMNVALLEIGSDGFPDADFGVHG